ncbi:uncharacterized protein PHALS_05061 [Plasmopara halstedii]|uniref:Uncharacterized protein n=1 Tax=Plasmopara halstedii TaxID=4781 RepID=A0A0P1AB18_PLAHL|nr:uncharacterized protein PHALS_05061 [Plasmopara halstedii]CEG37470.1 hypothetical protein PHALS_05061 [Plasmopara halstedii]|eukprot:XP_024573839.1 hypothetical protein PHALS_05061 [Plasmopara halstedii]
MADITKGCLHEGYTALSLFFNRSPRRGINDYSPSRSCTIVPNFKAERDAMGNINEAGFT